MKLNGVLQFVQRQVLLFSGLKLMTLSETLEGTAINQDLEIVQVFKNLFFSLSNKIQMSGFSQNSLLLKLFCG